MKWFTDWVVVYGGPGTGLLKLLDTDMKNLQEAEDSAVKD